MQGQFFEYIKILWKWGNNRKQSNAVIIVFPMMGSRDRHKQLHVLAEDAAALAG